MSDNTSITYTECAYCGADIDDDVNTPVPAVDDDAAWEALAERHGRYCDWIATRAHRIDCEPLDDEARYQRERWEAYIDSVRRKNKQY